MGMGERVRAGFISSGKIFFMTLGAAPTNDQRFAGGAHLAQHGYLVLENHMIGVQKPEGSGQFGGTELQCVTERGVVKKILAVRCHWLLL